MPADAAQTALERFLAAVEQCFDRQSAESLLRLRTDTEMQGRIEELAATRHGAVLRLSRRARRRSPAWRNRRQRNLALACYHCNAHKGPNLSGIDPESGELVRLFHPRQDRWDEHFERNGVLIVGRTAVGRATVGLLKMNAADRRRLRER
jgi:cation diffusion facilitator CzcD-associated flavoprotein CzcO